MTLAFLRCCLVLMLGCSSVSVQADQSEQALARRAMLAGEILPLQTILAELEKTHQGTVIEVELDDEDDGWVYEIELLRPTGRVTKLDIDAKTGRIIKEKNK